MTLFALVLLMLIASVLSYIYFLTARTERIKRMYQVTISILVLLTVAYTIFYIVSDMDAYSAHENNVLMYPYYLILFGYASLEAIPMAIQLSLSKKEPQPDNPEVPVEEESNDF